MLNMYNFQDNNLSKHFKSIIRLILNNQAKTLKVEFQSLKICALIIIMYNALYKSFHSFNTVKISLKSSLKHSFLLRFLGGQGFERKGELFLCLLHQY